MILVYRRFLVNSMPLFRYISPLLTGKAIRETELFILFMFMSGRNKRILPSLPLYAFKPSKHYFIGIFSCNWKRYADTRHNITYCQGIVKDNGTGQNLKLLKRFNFGSEPTLSFFPFGSDPVVITVGKLDYPCFLHKN
jgi:hypothetical protein